METEVDKIINRLKNGKYSSVLIALLLIIATSLPFINNTLDIKTKLQQSVEKNIAQADTIEKIRVSLRQYNLQVKNGIVSPIERIENSNSNSGINYGTVGDVYNQSKTYNKTIEDKQLVPQVPISKEENKLSIEMVGLPIFCKIQSDYCVVFKLKVKGDSEAEDINADFHFLTLKQSELSEPYTINNLYPKTLSSYPTDFIFFTPEEPEKTNRDTTYIYLHLKFNNSVREAQPTKRLIYRVTNNNKTLRKLNSGEEEYQRILSKIGERY